MATAAAAVEAAGGKALILPCDIRDEAQVKEAVEKTLAEFGRLDGVVNNASALNLRPTLALVRSENKLQPDMAMETLDFERT